MSLQERTLVVKNFDPIKTTKALIEELCMQTGPVKKVILKPDHAFVEFEDVESVGYSKALLDGIKMHGKKLMFVPKLNDRSYMKYTNLLQNYINYTRSQQQQQHIHHQHQQQLHQQRMQQHQLEQIHLQQTQHQQSIQFNHQLAPNPFQIAHQQIVQQQPRNFIHQPKKQPARQTNTTTARHKNTPNHSHANNHHNHNNNKNYNNTKHQKAKKKMY